MQGQYIGALCAQIDPEVFFPEKAGNAKEIGVAKQICRRCPVITECLTEALTDGSLVGIWGGTTQVERRKIIKNGKKAIAIAITKKGKQDEEQVA